MTRRALPGYRLRDCGCCTRPFVGATSVCGDCVSEHGCQIASNCPVYAAEEKAQAERIKALPASKPVSVSKEMQQRMWSLDT